MSNTIKDVLNRALKESGGRTALRFKRKGVWCTYTYRELHARVRQVSEICATVGVKPGDRVALYLTNSPEWFEIYFGIVCMGAIAVPVDVKLREQEVGHIFHDCGVSVVFASAGSAPGLSELKESLPNLQTAVLLDIPPESTVSSANLTVLSYDAARTGLSELSAYEQHDPLPSDPASLIYTSGTTGRQKGAVLTHQNFVSNAASCQKAIDIHPTDNFLLVLPLHHAFAFTTSLLIPVLVQCEVSLVERLKTIKADMRDTSPTILLAVPLLLEKMLARMMDTISRKPTARLLYKAGLAKLIGRRIHQELGGALRLIVSGGAPIDPDTLRSWQKLGFAIVEGYGITETGPVLSLNPPEKPRVGTVGIPLPDVQIQIINPGPDGSGEIIIKGPNVMQGYYNNPEATAESLRDGWFHSGDLGFFDEAGYLVINGRQKNLIVNREGKNIYPEEVEQQIHKSPAILECLVLGYREPGESSGERVGLIVVPDQEFFDTMETETGRRFSESDIEQFVRAEVRQAVQSLSDYKRPRCVQVRFDEFEKTTTAKIKRYLYAIDTVSL
ncbi:AMP-dependent synthetase/ligase [Tichowtungia aerotolerans]|uniref:AMP-binding protein n=1 Tax=Tichowtungia aerotolerans TaxID=2697043 RepID=A0A6P1M447_9BACT|nr:AMP-dependent synthetase/ligase [Tichowtungia aerotolerans]QHI68802.1 AMP-binding protein [Tichowtungia aerotolerans]